MSTIKAQELKCEYFDRPLGIDIPAPRFSFTPIQEGYNCKQSAYRIVVSTMQNLAAIGEGDMWDSGFVRSNKCCNIVYDGAPLKSCTRYYFTVQLADKDGVKGEISEVSYFETALMNQEDWQGCFIGMPANQPNGPAHYIRREFELNKPIARARAYVAGLGYYELYINGKRIGDRVMEPGFTDYSKRIFYSTYDVTENLTEGLNCVGAHIGKGWYKQSCMLLQLNVEYTDGTTTSVYTEPAKWDMMVSPVTFTNIYIGENYDHRFEVDGWNMPCGDLIERHPRQGWKVYTDFMPSPYDQYENPEYTNVYHRSFIALEAAHPGGKLEAQPLEPIRIVRTIKPVKITNPKEGVYVYDFGENIAGWVRFTATANDDRVACLKHSEILFDDGTINQTYLVCAELWGSGNHMQTDYFRLKPGTHTYEPHFTYHGFRYVQVEGLANFPAADDICACVVHTDVTQRGFFSCSNDLINTLQDNILRTETDNLHSIPTDCPQRDERMGWLNDMTVRYEEATYNFDMVHLYEKWAQDITDAQDPVSGAIPDTAPIKRGQRPADPCTASYLLVSNGLLDHCGDVRTVERQYEGYKKWTNYLYRQSIDGLLTYSYWGDWAGPRDYTTRQMCDAISSITPGEFISTGYLYHNLNLMAKYARILKKNDEAADFAARAQLVKDAFNKEFFNEETAIYSTGSQACLAFPLFLGVVPEGREAEVAAALNAAVVEKDYHLTTGNLCSKYVPEQLTRYGYVDTAYKLLTQTTYPSWGYMIQMGATTIWERWEYCTSHGMNSHNHPMYASISAYFYKYLAGITVENAAGFDTFSVCPYVPTDLDSAEAALNTVRGRVFSGWKKQDGKVVYTLDIPVGAEANVSVAGSAIEGIDVNTTTDNGRICFTLGSGKYTFSAK